MGIKDRSRSEIVLTLDNNKLADAGIHIEIRQDHSDPKGKPIVELYCSTAMGPMFHEDFVKGLKELNLEEHQIDWLVSEINFKIVGMAVSNAVR